MSFQFRNYQPTKADVRRACQEHGRPVSLTRLQQLLVGTAKSNHFKFVDWPWMKAVVKEMVASGELQRVREPKGFYRYEIPDD